MGMKMVGEKKEIGGSGCEISCRVAPHAMSKMPYLHIVTHRRDEGFQKRKDPGMQETKKSSEGRLLDSTFGCYRSFTLGEPELIFGSFCARAVVLKRPGPPGEIDQMGPRRTSYLLTSSSKYKSLDYALFPSPLILLLLILLTMARG